MWIFLASHDCTSSSSKLDSSVTSASLENHAAEASVQKLGFHDKEQADLGFHEKLEHSELGFHDKLQFAEAFQLGFHDKVYAKPGHLGFHGKLEYAGPAHLGFHDKNAHAEAGQARFPMTLRKLANAGVTTPTAASQVSPSIVVIIIVLTVIFFLSAFLHLLIRWLARNPALIRRGLRTGVHTGSNNRIIALTALQGQLQQLFSLQDAGLERSLIEELPVFSYKAAMDGLKEGADCAICLCEFVGDDQLRLLPFCGHAFHTECIDTWLLSHSTCPLCRALLLPECWIPGTLQPLISSEISTAGEADHQHVADATVTALSGRFTGLGSSSRRSSLGRITIIAGTTLDHNHTQLAAEPQFLHFNPLNPIANGTESAICEDPDVANPASIAASSSANSARLASSDPERSQSFTKIGNVYASSESEDRANHTANKGTNEGTSSANAKSFNVSNSATVAIMDSGRLSYTSLGAQSDTYNEVDRASAYGSGRRVSVHLGKCRVVREEGKSMRIPKASGGASRRSYSKGSYEYVIDSSSNLEIIIPPVVTLNSSLKPGPALISGSRLSELLNLSNRTSSSSVETMQNAAHGSRDLASKNLSPSWASASFRKLRLFNGGDVDTSVDAMNAPLNTSLPSDKPAMVDCLQVGITPELAESSEATSMRANMGSDASFSPEMVSERLREHMMGSNSVVSELETSKRAVSFRLPTPTSHDILSARLKASASRRALSESEAFSYWEPTTTEQYLDHASDDRRLFVDDDTGSHRSSSFARRTMDWLVGWQKRMVHPDKSAQAITSCNYPS